VYKTAARQIIWHNLGTLAQSSPFPSGTYSARPKKSQRSCGHQPRFNSLWRDDFGSRWQCR